MYFLVLHMDNIPTWKAVSISLGIALLVALLVQFILVPMQRRKIMGQPVHFTFGDSDGNYWPTDLTVFAKQPAHSPIPIIRLELHKTIISNPIMSPNMECFIAESSPGGSPKRVKRPLSLVCDPAPLPAITEMTEFMPKPQTPNSIYTDPNIVKNGFPLSNGGDYKMNPEVVRKAELFGKSLDNSDLTVTSLNFVDEYQKSPFNGIFDFQKNGSSPLELNRYLVIRITPPSIY